MIPEMISKHFEFIAIYALIIPTEFNRIKIYTENQTIALTNTMYRMSTEQ
jgi:hypothetical protein